MARIPLNGNPRINTYHGQAGWGKFNKHLGIDYNASVGTPIYAPVGGTINERVETSGPGSGGKRLQLAGRDGKWHRFLHLSGWNVSVGATVHEGQLLGWSGNTGDTTGPHLHWDVRRANTAWNSSFDNYVDPIAWINQLNASVPAPGNTITIKKGTWNVRIGEGTNYQSLGVAVGGQKYDAVVMNTGWARITFQGKTGYVGPSAYTGASAPSGQTVVVNTGTWNVRSKANTSSSVLGYAIGGQRYGGATIDSNGWAKITFNGNTGYLGPKSFKKG